MSEQDTPKKNPFDFMEKFKLRPKKIDEKYKKYAGLNRRMMAATIDSFIAIFTIGPVIDWIMGYSAHSRDITIEEISAIQNIPDVHEEIVALWKVLTESGKLYEFLLSSSLQVILLILASVICWKFWSATPGKMLLGMKIVDAYTEQPMTNRQIIIRGLGYIPACAVLFIGIFWIGLNKRKQGWHDKMANTVVIINSKNKIADVSKELS